MKVVFVSNNFNHHERPFCDALYELVGADFCFVQTQPMRAERVEMGWGIDVKQIPYCVCSYGENNEQEEALALCNAADVVILGNAPYEFISDRVKKNKLTFFYAERLFRKGLWHMLYPPTFFAVLKRFIFPGRKSNFFLLAASAYTAWDTSRIFAFNNHRFKWGHYIEVDCPKNRNCKGEDGKVHLLWAGRFLKLKHPDYSIRIAKKLKEQGVKFVLDIIGSGGEEENMRQLIAGYNLEGDVVMHGAMKPTEVRAYMEQADIYMFTSDFNEGWGAVLGEAMTSGCAVVTSHGIGATPFLVQHKHNGLIYETGRYDSFERNVLKLVASAELREELSRNAMATMQSLWNPKVGAHRFFALCQSLIETGKPLYYEEGPISEAKILKNNWFKDDTI